ncbi:MAG: MurR/RpiR family transcriptional regulator [Ignavibacteriales bacterium]|nr:MurR/RpiR family transcriptional regulator [Ignavibacteriales bacterium]
MVRYKHIKERIQLHYESLSANHKHIANFFIENFDKIPFLTIHDVAKATNTSVASIIRFTQRVGFSGYTELQREIATTLQNHLQKKEIFPLLDKGKFNEDVLTEVANQDISNINETLALNERENFHKAVELILSSNRVYTFGLGISYLLSEILAYQLNQVAVDARAFVFDSANFLEQILFLDKKDLIIALSFPPYSKETIEAAKFAAERKIKVMAITNRHSSPITFYSNVNLVVKSENMLFTNSFAAISVMINAIATECAVKNKLKAKKMLKEMNKIQEIQSNTID